MLFPNSFLFLFIIILAVDESSTFERAIKPQIVYLFISQFRSSQETLFEYVLPKV